MKLEINKKEKLKSLNYEALLGETEAEVQKRKALFNEEDFADTASNIYNQFSSIKQLLNEGETTQSIVDKLGKTKINNKRYEADFYSLSNAAGIDLNNRKNDDKRSAWRVKVNLPENSFLYEDYTLIVSDKDRKVMGMLDPNGHPVFDGNEFSDEDIKYIMDDDNNDNDDDDNWKKVLKSFDEE